MIAPDHSEARREAPTRLATNSLKIRAELIFYSYASDLMLS
jgi:hypothetical protein